MELIVNASTGTPATALTTGLPCRCLPLASGSECGLGLVWMVSGMDSNLDGCGHVYEASCGGVWPQLDEAGD